VLTSLSDWLLHVGNGLLHRGHSAFSILVRRCQMPKQQHEHRSTRKAQAPEATLAAVRGVAAVSLGPLGSARRQMSSPNRRLFKLSAQLHHKLINPFTHTGFACMLRTLSALARCIDEQLLRPQSTSPPL